VVPSDVEQRGSWGLRGASVGSIVVRNGVEQGQLVVPDAVQIDGVDA
jgi:hypothetical protein